MQQHQAEILHFTPEQSENSPFEYGNGDPNNPESYTCTNVRYENSEKEMRKMDSILKL